MRDSHSTTSATPCCAKYVALQAVALSICATVTRGTCELQECESRIGYPDVFMMQTRMAVSGEAQNRTGGGRRPRKGKTPPAMPPMPPSNGTAGTPPWAMMPPSDGMPSAMMPPSDGMPAAMMPPSGMDGAALPPSTGMPDAEVAPPGGGTVAAAAPGVLSAIGDPHLVNVHGEHFDVLKPGVHVLLLVPFRANRSDALLAVEADAQRIGDACADTYFMSVNITGKWAEAKLHSHRQGSGHGLMFSAGTGASHTGTKWMSFGKIALKVVHGRTDEGIAYLNFFARNLRGAGYPIGGLLGEDDHSEATTPRRECRRVFDV